MTTIELTTEDAQAFRTFREHQGFYQGLIDVGLHTMHNANVIMNFNADGELAKIRVDKVVFHYGK